jgi:RimJ/RimL family protein N-acetyltransferase
VRYAFEHLNIFSISAEVEEGNVAMMKVLEKVGFKHDGLFESARVKKQQRISVHHFGIVKPY